MAERILIFRCGSLGDMVVSVPAINLIRRSFPSAEFRLLTDINPELRAVPAQDIVMQSGSFSGWFAYPLGTRNFSKLLKLGREIREWQPDVLAYMSPFPSLKRVCRDVAFFKLAGVRQILGAPLRASQRSHIYNDEKRMFESEASRLLRCFSSLGTADLCDTETWNLHPTCGEKSAAETCLSGWEGRKSFICINIGTKVPANDWGMANWRSVIEAVGAQYPSIGLAALGTYLDSDGSAELLAAWAGPRLNLCGMTTPRVSALVLQEALAYLGHDSGPMHLAAAVGTPCVSVFSRHNLPGWWFPPGEKHSIFYPYLPDGTLKQEEAGIHDTRPDAVIAALLRHL